MHNMSIFICLISIYYYFSNTNGHVVFSMSGILFSYTFYVHGKICVTGHEIITILHRIFH